jgi:hypothetical protein
MNKDLVFNPDYFRERLKKLNKGKYKREQSQEVQLRKIALAQEKRERKALKKEKN